MTETPCGHSLHTYLHARDSGLAHKLLGTARGRLLDVGSGEGEDLALLEQRGWSVVGIEPRRRGRDSRTIPGVGEKLPFRNGSFSAVTCILVLPHASSPDGIVREVYRVLRPAGRAAFVVFSWSPFNIRIAVTRYDFSSAPTLTAARLYTERGIRRLLRTGGFQNIRAWRSDCLPWMTAWMPSAIRLRLLRALDRSDRRLADGLFVFLARKIVVVGVKE